MTGASTSVRYSAPRMSGEAITLVNGRVTLSMSMARASRTGYFRDQAVS